MKVDELEKYFLRLKSNNTIGHAYLFSNVTYDEILEEIKKVCDKCFFEDVDLQFDFNPDIYLIEPEKDVIKKEKIIELENNISKTSQVSNNKVYIIKECEKLNSSAANCLLKTLEEPNENVYAFLITKNLESVISTIKSRCQILTFENIKNTLVSEAQLINVIDFVNTLEDKKVKSILYMSDMYRKIDKSELKELLFLLEYFYEDCLNFEYGLKLNYYKEHIEILKKICANNNIEKIIKKMKIINYNISLLKYNLNLSLFIDKLLIELGRI